MTAFTRKQIANILKVNGKHMLPAARFRHSLSGRVCETWMQRRLFAWEDQTVIGLWEEYKRAYQSIQSRGYQLADHYQVDTLEPTGASVMMRRDLVSFLPTVLEPLLRVVARSAYDAARTAYVAGYYGRAWLLNEMTRDDVPIATSPPSPQDVGQAVLQGRLREQVGEDDIIYRMLGVEWREQFAMELDDLLVGIRRSLNRSMAEGLGIRPAMRGVADVMGVSTDRRQGFRANFNRIQTITRSYIIEASNHGAMELYRQNTDVLDGVEWLAMRRDNRTCDMCLGLDGQSWDVDDPSQPEPVRDTHPNCRCSKIPQVKEVLRIPANVPPRNTFADFVLGLGVGFMMEDFLQGRRLQTNRVGAA